MTKVIYTASCSLTLGTPFMGLLCKHGWLSLRISNHHCMCIFGQLSVYFLCDEYSWWAVPWDTKIPELCLLSNWKMYIFFSLNLHFPVLLSQGSWPTNRPFVSAQEFVCLLLHQMDDLWHLLCLVEGFPYSTIFEAIPVIVCFWLT